jgi:tetratricopeptide (TPR) repeat protein
MGLSLYQLSTDSLWLDEILTGFYAREPNIRGVLDHLAAKSGRPLYFIIAHLVTLLGEGEFFLRLPSVVAATLGLVVTYKVGEALFGRREGLIAALLLALSPLYIRYSQEARAYALLAFLSMLSLYCFLQAWRLGNWRWWVGFIVASVLNMYTHYFSLFVLAAVSIYAGLLFIRDILRLWRDTKSTMGSRWHWTRRQILSLLLSLLFIGLAFLPSFSHLQGFLDRQAAGDSLAQGIHASSRFFIGLWAMFTTGNATVADNPINIWFLGILFTLGLVSMGLRRQGHVFLLVCLWIGLPFLALFMIPTRHFFHIRFVLFLLPILDLVIAHGITGVADIFRSANRWPANQYLLERAAWPMLLLLLGFISFAPLTQYYKEEKEDWRGAANYLKAHIQPGDLIICDGARVGGGRDGDRPYKALSYYLPEAFEENAVVLQQQSAATIAPIAGEERGVWGLVYGSLRNLKQMRDNQLVKPIQFKAATVLSTQDVPGTVLDKGILLSQSLLNCLRDEAKVDLYLELGNLYALQGDQDLARTQYVQALSCAPGPIKAADLYQKLGEFEKAETSYRRALADDEQAHNIHFKLGTLYAETNRPALALEEYRRASELDPQNAGYRARVGLMNTQLDKMEAAKQDFEKAIELDPDNAWYHLLRANTLQVLGEAQEAVGEYEQALALNPDYQHNAWFQLQRAHACRLAGRIEEAIAAYKQVLALDAGNAQAAQWLAELK